MTILSHVGGARLLFEDSLERYAQALEARGDAQGKSKASELRGFLQCFNRTAPGDGDAAPVVELTDEERELLRRTVQRPGAELAQVHRNVARRRESKR